MKYFITIFKKKGASMGELEQEALDHFYEELGSYYDEDDF